MISRFVRLKVPLVVSIAVTLLTGYPQAGSAQESIPGTEGVVSIYPVLQGVAGFHEEAEALIWFKKDGKSLAETRRIPVKGHVWGVSEAGDTTYIAEGMGRKDLAAPLRIVALRANDSREVIFEHNGERNQASFLRFVDGKLWLTYFESKYITRSGYCDLTSSTKCSFVEVARMRLGDAVDVRGDSIVIGRPYGDVSGQDGDLFLIENGKQTLLPSYRGVRAVTFFGDPSALKIAIGDGWHQNYGQLAQGRLSVLSKEPGSTRYSLSLVDKDSGQYGFSRLIPFSKKGEAYLAALGNKTLSIYGPSPEWSKADVYTRTNENGPFDLTVVPAGNSEVEFVVLDQGLRVVSR